METKALLLELLKNFISVSKEIDNATIYTKEGNLIADYNEGGDQKDILEKQKLFKELFENIKRVYEFEKFSSGSFYTPINQIIFSVAGPNTILLCACTKEINLNHLFPIIYLVAEKIAQIIEGSFNPEYNSLEIPNLSLYDNYLFNIDKYDSDLEKPLFDSVYPLHHIEREEQTQKVFKLIVLGAAAVGKTTLVGSFQKKDQKSDYRPTLGISISSQIYFMQGFKENNTTLLIYDIAGQNFFKKLRHEYYQGADYVFIVYDITRRDTLDEAINFWYADIRKDFGDLPILLIGNKIDLEQNREISINEGEEVAKKMKASFIETSALKKVHVRDTFNFINIRLFLKNLDVSKDKEFIIKNLRDKLLLYETSYKEIFEKSPYSILITNADGTILDCNSATERLFGFSKDEMLNKYYETFIAIPKKQLMLTLNIEKEMFTGQIPEMIIVGAKKNDNTLLKIGVQFCLIEFDDKLYIYFMIQDVTDREKSKKSIHKLQEKIEKEQRFSDLGKIAGQVAHELRNPLAAIKNNLYYLSAIFENPIEEYSKTLSNIESDIERMNKIIKSLLNYSRIEKLEYTLLDINSIIENMLNRFKIPENIEVIKKYQEELPPFKGDRIRFEEIIINIIQNAIDAMQNGGKLVLTTMCDEKNIQILIQDTGVGIKNEDKAKLFSPLFSTKVWGFGLGLSIVKKYVELHNGVINIISQFGEGTTVELNFPLNNNEH